MTRFISHRKGPLAGGLAIALALGTGSACAETSVLIGTSSYEAVSNLSNARTLRLAEQPLRAAGFDVIAAMDASTEDIRAAFGQLVEAGEEQAIAIVLVGHFAQSADGEVWFLGAEVDGPNRGNIGGQGVPLSTVMALAARTPGRSLVLLGTDARRIPFGVGLAPGVTLPEPPQGVTLALGQPRAVTQFARRELAQPGVSLAEALAEAGFQTAGFLSPNIDFLPAAASAPSPDPVAAPDPDTNQADLWAAVQELNTEGAYISYLRQYPTGQFAAQARAALEDLRDPLRIAAEAEAGLGFNRATRRQIQSDLTVLGFDTNGIDGIFGNGTRGAIRGWQAFVGLDETGYLNRVSLRQLGEEAAIRRAELEAEEAVRAAERDRLDRAYWAATGRGADEAGLRAYLARYSDGVFSDLARDRLTEIEGARAGEAAAEDRAAWQFASRQDSARAYRGYLAAHPEGEFASEAANRIAALEGRPAPFPEVDEAALAAREDALNLPTITRLLIERQLDTLGLDPGPMDGRFDPQTRAAIARYQESQGLPATGYLDQPTAQRFLEGGFQIILR